MIKTSLIALLGTAMLGTGAVKADLTPKNVEMTAGFVTMEFGGEDGFKASVTKTMEFNIKMTSEEGKTLTIRL